MKIGFATNDWSRTATDTMGHPVIGGSGFIRIGQYIKPLRDAGYNVVIGILAQNKLTGTFGIHSWDGVDSFDCDVIVMQRYMHMQVLPDMKRAQAAGQIILNDVDDWYWGLSDKNQAKSASDPELNKNENVLWYKNILEQCDGIITSTPFLHQKIKEWNPNTMLHGNYVDRSKYNTRRIHEKRSDKMVVGWMGSTAHRSGDLEILQPYSASISKFATWHHTGHMQAPNIPLFHKEIKVSAGCVTTHPFLAPYELEKGFLFDVGIVPLTNIAFNHAKSYIKGLEYACGGVPFVASWSPQYEELVEVHGIGEIARDPKDFVKLLKKYQDVDYRQEISDLNWKRVKKFDVRIGATRLIKTINNLVKRAR